MAQSMEEMRRARLAALDRSSGAPTNPTPTSVTSSQQHNRDHYRPPAPAPAPLTHSNTSNIHTLSSIRSNPGSGTRLAANSRTQVVTETHGLYVRLPSKQITSEQLVQFIRTQFGVNVVVSHMNQKHQSYQMTERNFCFVDCDSKEDMERLIDEMNDSTIGDWDDPIMVKEKKDHPN